MDTHKRISTFNSLFEMLTARQGSGRPSSSSLSILYLRCIWRGRRRRRPLAHRRLSILYLRCLCPQLRVCDFVPEVSFNSLFEMLAPQCGGNQEGKKSVSFNSLFEMRSGISSNTIAMATCLSILYLRCRHIVRHGDCRWLHHLSILYLRCCTTLFMMSLRHSSTDFQFSI